MPIIGIGVDIVKNGRLKKLIKNKKFIERVFTNNEQKISKRFKNKINYFSKRFAAKEAFQKQQVLGYLKIYILKIQKFKKVKKANPQLI